MPIFSFQEQYLAEHEGATSKEVATALLGEGAGEYEITAYANVLANRKRRKEAYDTANKKFEDAWKLNTSSSD